MTVLVGLLRRSGAGSSWDVCRAAGEFIGPLTATANTQGSLASSMCYALSLSKTWKHWLDLGEIRDHQLLLSIARYAVNLEVESP